MKIVVAGGTGFIGKRLVEALIKEKHSVNLLTRNPESGKNFSSLTVMGWDAKSPGPWYAAVNQADAVINLSGEPIAARRWTAEQKKKIIESRIQSTKAIVEAIAKADQKPAVLINASAVGYYGDVRKGEVTENSPQGKGFIADTCAQWENSTQGARTYGVRVVLLRTGIVLERNGGALQKMLPPFQLYLGGPLGSGKQWFPWIHRDDIIGSILFSLENPAVRGPINLTSPHPVTMNEFCRKLGKMMHRLSFFHVPAFILKILLGEMSEMLVTGQKVIPKKLIENRYSFRYPDLEKALQAILR